MTYFKVETEGSGFGGNFSSILIVQYFFLPPIIANMFIVRWLKNGNDSSQDVAEKCF